MSAQISQARLAANRANAQKSTGPRTAEGKARVAGNATTHGLRSEHNPLDHATCLSAEREAHTALLADFTAELHPATPIETALVERLTHIQIRLARAARMETAQLEIQLHLMDAPNYPMPIDDAQTRDTWLTTLAFLKNPSAITLISQYESRLSRDFAKTLAQIRQSQKLRNQTQPAMKTLERSQHPGTGSSVPSATNAALSGSPLQARVASGACPPTDAQTPKSETCAKQTQAAPISTPSDRGNTDSVSTLTPTLTETPAKQTHPTPSTPTNPSRPILGTCYAATLG